MDNPKFNIEEFDIKLDTERIAKRFVYILEVDSTNSFLLNSKEFDEDGTVVLAEEQKKGRGRLQREWLSAPDKNLTFSILLRNVDPKKINIINLGSSLAVSQAISNLYQLNTVLKWPNDVLIDGKKISGILLESTSRNTELDRVVIGVGINVNQSNFPGRFLIEPTSIRREFNSIVSRERLLSEVINTFEEVINIIETDPQQVIDDWKDRCKMIGEKIKISSDKESKFGIFEDIDQDGFLILKSANNKSERIHFGDVSLNG
ncbi:MAG: biotin--[acetyl-CoA-carboxylase] ligase [Melioribacteraceae bacterium]|nr:biotin--[acetyl-CoA-carboxylase] ligase [Melioribacteraceae bacterium]